jgi:hypothetical protein
MPAGSRLAQLFLAAEPGAGEADPAQPTVALRPRLARRGLPDQTTPLVSAVDPEESTEAEEPPTGRVGPADLFEAPPVVVRDRRPLADLPPHAPAVAIQPVPTAPPPPDPSLEPPPAVPSPPPPPAAEFAAAALTPRQDERSARKVDNRDRHYSSDARGAVDVPAPTPSSRPEPRRASDDGPEPATAPRGDDDARAIRHTDARSDPSSFGHKTPAPIDASATTPQVIREITIVAREDRQDHDSPPPRDPVPRATADRLPVEIAPPTKTSEPGVEPRFISTPSAEDSTPPRVELRPAIAERPSAPPSLASAPPAITVHIGRVEIVATGSTPPPVRQNRRSAPRPRVARSHQIEPRLPISSGRR